jgi:hypothetical protein
LVYESRPFRLQSCTRQYLSIIISPNNLAYCRAWWGFGWARKAKVGVRLECGMILVEVSERKGRVMVRCDQGGNWRTVPLNADGRRAVRHGPGFTIAGLYGRLTLHFKGEAYRIRTCDPLLKRQLLCQTELTPHTTLYCTISLIIWQAARFAMPLALGTRQNDTPPRARSGCTVDGRDRARSFGAGR